MNKYEKIYAKACTGGKRPNWIDTVIQPLVADLEMATGLSARMHGPFGIRCECCILLNENAVQGERKQILITPDFNFYDNETEIMLYYDTGEVDNTYPPKSIGAINGMNNIRKRLPDTLEEIVVLLQTY